MAMEGERCSACNSQQDDEDDERRGRRVSSSVDALIDHCSLQAATSERAHGVLSKTAASAKQSTGTESRSSRSVVT